MKPMQLCATPGCSGVSHSTYCPACGVGGHAAPRSAEQQRTYNQRRGGSGWANAKNRARVLRRDGYQCAMADDESGIVCSGPLRADHIITLETTAALGEDMVDDSDENKRALCLAHHRAVTKGGGG